MTDSTFTIIGHRGARGHAPENTLLAIDVGIRLGAHMVEIDVQLHSGELLVIHDLRVERTTNGHGRVDELSFEALRALDAGQGQRIPTLDEVIDLVEGRVPINIELKTGPGTAEAVATSLSRRLASEISPSQFLVSSFHLPELYEFRQMLPAVPIGVLLCGVPLDWAACAAELQAECVNLSDEFVDERLIADARNQGRRVYVYTVNHIDDMRRLHHMGVDGVFTDYPDRGLELLRDL